MPNVDIWSSLVVGCSIHSLLFFISFHFYSFSNQCVECWYAHFVPIEYYYCCNYFPHVFKRCHFTTSTTRTINRNEKNCEKKWKDIYFYADFCDFLYFHLFFCHPFSIVWIHCIFDMFESALCIVSLLIKIDTFYDGSKLVIKNQRITKKIWTIEATWPINLYSTNIEDI